MFKNKKCKKFFDVKLCCTLLFIIFVIKGCSKYMDSKLWNDGNCIYCGGNWVYDQAVGHYNSTSYLYHCDNCDKTIEIYTRY